MGFFGPVPFTTAEATYAWMGAGGGSPGAFFVTVSGDAKNYTAGISLERNPKFVEGVEIEVRGWTGPLGEGTTPYTVHHSFPGDFMPKITISGENQTILIDVKEIPADEADDFVQSQVAAATPA
jgi:hypothetical protein